MQHLNNKYLYENEEILERAVFTKVPVIALWIILAVISIIYIAVGASIHFPASSIAVPVIVWLLLGVVFTLKYLSRELVITNKRIMFKSGILNINFLDIPLNKIQSIRCNQTFWQRIFEYGTVVISNSTFWIVGYRFNGVTNFETLKTVIMCVLDDYEYMKYECINCNIKSQIAKTPPSIEHHQDIDA